MNKQYTAEQLVENYNRLLEIAKTTFSGDRLSNVLKLFSHFEERMLIAPASSFDYFHGAYPGGFIDHTLNVITAAKAMYVTWQKLGADMSGYTKEDLIFSAMFHDLGKLGDMDNDLYVPCTSEWHQKNQGRLYESNPKLTHMEHWHRSLFLLQQFGITTTDQEFIAILTHHAMYEEQNKTYYVLQFNKSRMLRTNLHYILHEADIASYRIECEQEGILDKVRNA